MADIILENNEFLRQFETKIENSLARIEYAEQERKIFLTKVVVPDTIKDKDFEGKKFGFSIVACGQRICLQ